MTKTMIINFPNARIAEAKIRKDGSCELVINYWESKEDDCILIEASKLSLNDNFMQYEPRTNNESRLKNLLNGAIQKGIKDFWQPRLDPSFSNEDKKQICYISGKKPAVGKSYNWWEKTAKEYNPRRRSRLGTKSEYVAFLGVLIKALVSEGWSIADAWDAVCNDSKKLGHYLNSENAKHNLETTGSRKTCGFFDLANTYKILAEDEEARGFWLAGGCYFNCSDSSPLADLYRSLNLNYDNCSSVGWLVFEEGSADY